VVEINTAGLIAVLIEDQKTFDALIAICSGQLQKVWVISRHHITKNSLDRRKSLFHIYRQHLMHFVHEFFWRVSYWSENKTFVWYC